MEPINCKFTRVLFWSMAIAIFLFLVGCTQDEIEPAPQPQPLVTQIFEETNSIITNKTPINFEVLSEELYTLVIRDLETNSVLTKETFQSTIGLNTKTIYTKILPKKELELSLLDSTDNLVKHTTILVE